MDPKDHLDAWATFCRNIATVFGVLFVARAAWIALGQNGPLNLSDANSFWKQHPYASPLTVAFFVVFPISAVFMAVFDLRKARLSA